MDDFCIIYNLGSLIRVLTSYENPSKPSCIDLIMLKIHQNVFTTHVLSQKAYLISIR